MKSAGYSGTPLWKKLGLKPGSTIFTIAAPKNYKSWLAPIPANVKFVSKAPAGGADIVHLFVTSLAEFEKQLPKSHKVRAIDGAIWVSWYKKSANIPTDVTEDVVRNRALKTDLVDVKVCAVTDIWSGLKLVVRKHLR
jgi:hypothetical protein